MTKTSSSSVIGVLAAACRRARVPTLRSIRNSLLLAALLAPALASALNVDVELVSRAAPGDAAGGASPPKSLSTADGRYTVFASRAANVVAGVVDGNAVRDVFLFDRVSGVITLVSRALGQSTQTPNGASEPVAISADGNWVLFRSDATDVIAGVSDTNLVNDVFLFERATGITTLVSRALGSPTQTANNVSSASSVSPDGSWVLFRSLATDVTSGVVDTNGVFDVFLFDRATGTTTLVSRALSSPTQTPNGDSEPAAISADGSRVLYSSQGTNVIAGVTDVNGNSPDVFLFDRISGGTILVSRVFASSTQTSNDSSYPTALSADGNDVLFYSFATDLIGGIIDTNGTADAFVFDLASGSTTLISRQLGSATQTANGDSLPTAISANGLVVLFGSTASDLIGGLADSNGEVDAFVFDRASGSTILVSRALGSPLQTPNNQSQPVALSADGNRILFGSNADNLIAGVNDNNGSANDVYLFDRAGSTTLLVSRALGSMAQTPNAGSQPVAIDANGGWTLFQSSATNVVSGVTDNNNLDDVFLFERASGITTLVSRAQGTAAQTANDFSEGASISGDGNLVLFGSSASNLVAGVTDGNGVGDVFLRDRVSGSTLLVSRALGSATQSANAESAPTAISADGNWVLYRSRATDIVVGAADSNNDWDVFLFDRASGFSTLVSRAFNSPTQTPGDGYSWPVALSTNGGRVLFYSFSVNLIGGVADSNGAADVFVFDRASGTSTLVSRALGSANQTPNAGSFAGSISADGNRVLFYSFASNLIAGVADANGANADVYLFDLTGGSATLVSRALGSPTQTANNHSQPTAISADGNWVLYFSRATDLVSGVSDANGATDVFLFDRVSASTSLVSRALGSALTTSNGYSLPAAISGDGNLILYFGVGSNVVAGVTDNNAAEDVFLFDRSNAATTLISRASAAPLQTPAGSSFPVTTFSADGNRFVYYSNAANIVSGGTDANGDLDAFLFERAGASTTLVSRAASSASLAANGQSLPVAISVDGSAVLFNSFATDLVAGVVDGNGTSDVFVADVAFAEPTTTTIIADLPDPSSVGQAVVIQVAVTGTGSQPTDGQVVITASTGEICTDTTSAPGTGTTALFSCSITFASSGSRTLTATYSGSATHSGSTSAVEAHQVQQPTTTTIVSHVPSATVVGQAYLVTVNVTGATLSPPGTIIVRDGAGPGSASCGPILLSAGTAPTSSASCSLTSVSAGAKTLTAEYIPANSDFAASVSAGVSHQVGPAATAISVSGPARTRINQLTTFTFALSVEAPGAGTPAGTVTLSSAVDSCSVIVPTATPSCALSFSVLGPHTISAAFAPSNGDFSASVSSGAGNAQTLVYALADIAVTKSNGAATYRPGDLIVYTVTVRNNGPDSAVNIRIRDDIPAGLVNVVWSCDASGGAVCPQSGGNGDLDVMVPVLVSGGVLNFTFYGNVSGSPGQIVNTALVELPADDTIEDPTPGNNSATDTDLLEELFRDGFEGPAVNAPTGSYRLPQAALRSGLGEVAVAVHTLTDAAGEALRVYAREFDGRIQYALATRDGSGALRLGAWASYVVEPTLSWSAVELGDGWVLTGAGLR